VAKFSKKVVADRGSHSPVSVHLQA